MVHTMKLSIPLLLILLAAQLALAEPTGKAGQVTAADVRATIDLLGNESWYQRQKAQEKLHLLGKLDHQQVLDTTIEHYLEEDDPEVRFRLKEVIRDLVIAFHFQEQRGYLGILLRPVRFAERVDDQLVYPLRVHYIFPQTTADVDKLEIGDLLIKVDDFSFDSEFGYSQLMHYIQTRKPGDTVRFTVLENGQQTVKPVVLGEQPPSPNDLPPEERQSAFFHKWFRGQIDLVGRQLPHQETER